MFFLFIALPEDYVQAFFRRDDGGGHCLVRMEWHPAG